MTAKRKRQNKYNVPAEFRKMMYDAIDEQQRSRTSNTPHKATDLPVEHPAVMAEDSPAKQDKVLELEQCLFLLLENLPHFWRMETLLGSVVLYVKPNNIERALKALEGLKHD